MDKVVSDMDEMGNRTDIDIPEHNKITEDDDGIVKAAKQKAQDKQKEESE